MALRALLGRNREIGQLETALEQALAGRGSVFLLSGEPGIGKTRLAEDLAERAERLGAAVFWGRAWEVEGAPACWPWVQVLGACAPPHDAHADADLAPLLSGGRPATGPGDPELESMRLGAAIVALLRRLAAARPLVLVFDDLHASDLASLTLLQQVARELRGMRVLIVGTYREVEARRAPKVSGVLARLARDGTARPLGRLDRDAVARWVEDALGASPSPDLVSAVFAATEGNPLFVEAVSQLLAARGHGATLPPGFVLPDGIRETLHDRAPGT